MIKVLCLSASNIMKTKEDSISYKISALVEKILQQVYQEEEVRYEIIELKRYQLEPCIGCGACYEHQQCVMTDDFNQIYQKISDSNLVFIVSPHYAPIPARLCMVLEKMEQISFLRWNKDNSFKPPVFDIPTGIISHGGGGDWALKEYKKVVNDAIANALDTIMMQVVPFDEEWNTGITIPVKKIIMKEEQVFPDQVYDWQEIEQARIRPLVKNMCAALRSKDEKNHNRR